MRKLQGLLIGSAALISAIVHAGMPLPATWSPDCVVAIVKAVSDEPATNERPPHVTLEIAQVLRGDPNSDRRQGLWEPPPNDIDTSGREAELNAWKAKPMEKPKVGDKYIVFGRTVRQEKGSVFYIRGDGAIPFSAERLEQTLKLIKYLEEQTKAYQAKMDAEKKALAEAQARWRARVTARDIAEYTREADFVGIGTGAGTYQISRILKGSKRYTYRDDSCFVRFDAPKAISSLLDRSTAYLLFLSEKGLTLEPSVPHYLGIKKGDGIVIADDAALKAVEDELQKSPATISQRRPVVFLSVLMPGNDEGLKKRLRQIELFEQAAGDTCLVFKGRLFSYHDPKTTSAQLAKIVPGVDFLVLITGAGYSGNAKDTECIIRMGPPENEVVFVDGAVLGDEKAILTLYVKMVQKTVACQPSSRSGGQEGSKRAAQPTTAG